MNEPFKLWVKIFGLIVINVVGKGRLKESKSYTMLLKIVPYI